MKGACVFPDCREAVMAEGRKTAFSVDTIPPVQVRFAKFGVGEFCGLRSL